MVIRSAFLMTALVLNPHLQGGQAAARAGITIVLPPSVASETAQIRYFMIGPFGGYGGYVEAERGRTSYTIDPSVNGKRALDVTVIAYLPGCEFVRLDVPVEETDATRWLPCRKLVTRTVFGQIPQTSLDANHEAHEVQVEYDALWSHEFFGITDGMVMSFRVATAAPDVSGAFVATLPDFRQQSDLGAGDFRWTLSDKKTGNRLASLIPSGKNQGVTGSSAGADLPTWVTFAVREP